MRPNTHGAQRVVDHAKHFVETTSVMVVVVSTA
jgi:hypothetical protein